MKILIHGKKELKRKLKKIDKLVKKLEKLSKDITDQTLSVTVDYD